MARLLLALATLAALIPSSDAGSSVAVADSASGANPIRRVVSLLQGMAKKVAAEGEKEEELFEKFQCYCKTSGGNLAQSISESNSKIPQVQSDIEESEAELKRLQQDLKSHQEDRIAAKAAMDAATGQREGEHKQFVATSDEHKSFISALSDAMAKIQQGMAGGFLQTSTGAKLRQAIAADSSVTEYDRQLVASFLAGGIAADDGYVPKSGEITGILDQIKQDFEKSLAEVTSTEQDAVKLYEELMAAKTKQVSTLNAAVEKKTARIGELQVNIVNMKNDLTEEEAALVADQKLAADLDKNCASKASEWEERKKTRADELVAIHDTIKVLNDDDALDLFKKTLPSPSLLQVQASQEQIRRRALALLRRPRALRAGRPELDFMALALSGRKVDFSKVTKMIDDMMALLVKEQTDDDHKKEYCGKQIDMTEDKAKALGEHISDLEASVAEKEEAIAALAAEIKELTEGIAALDKSVVEATDQRKKEHEEYQELITSDSAAKELIAYAKNRLNKFYNPALYKAPPKVELSRQDKIYTNFGGTMEPTEAPGGIADTGISAVQLDEPAALVQVSLHRRRVHEAPAPPPSTWDAYSTKKQETTGVIAMMDLLIKDLDKEMTEAETQEKESQKGYEAAMDDAAKKRAADLKSVAGKEKAKADFEEGKTTDEASAKVESKELQATKMYEMQLHQECDWLVQNYDLRKQARAEESSSLKDAKAVLSGADFALVQGKAAGRAPTRRLRGH